MTDTVRLILKHVFGVDKGDPKAKTREIVELADEVAHEAETFKELMQPYLRSKDPFIALTADLYNKKRGITP